MEYFSSKDLQTKNDFANWDVQNFQLSVQENIYCKAAVVFFKIQIRDLKACFGRKRMKAPIEQVNDYLIVECNLS